ncbi:hypothetical protein BC830DRAFT_798374 [Chytriomyces sp. MP71]|nr:hypothetical protein BC830DRAFT_798374 [Chytriomyces sp. MP71]
MEQSLIVHETHAAKYDYVATDETKMSFVAGDVIRVHQKASTGWWYGSVDGDRFGWFPSNYVEPFEEETDVGSTMDESFYIRCETVDGQVYHVHRFTGETYWENTPSTPKQEASVISPSSSQFTPSSYGRSHSIDHLDTGRSNSSNPSLNYTASTLPVNWSRIEGPEGQTLYYNTITKELQYSMPEGAGMEIKHALPPPTAIVRDAEEIPPNWGKKFTWDGRGYYFNYVTDLVVWDLTEVDPVSGNLLNDAINLPEADNRLTALVDITYPFPDSAWPHLTQEVTNALINLDVLARIGKKESYLNESANLMEAARMLLLSSRVSPAPKPIRLLVKTYHNNVMLSLAKVIKAAAVANGVWPPPDAQISLIQSCFEATTMVREFVLAVVAGGLNITQSDIERATESIKGSEDPDAADEIKKASNGEIAVNLKTRHAQIEVRVTDAIAALQQNAFATSKSTVISSIRLIMTDVGDFMSSVEDDIPLDILSSEISEEVRIRKDSLYNAVSSLQVPWTCLYHPSLPFRRKKSLRRRKRVTQVKSRRRASIAAVGLAVNP